MKQVIQNFKTGELYVEEMPVPFLTEGMVLVENRFSLISAGTEKGTVKTAQASLLGKAKARPDLVAQVLQNIRKEGLAATMEKVKTKLDSLKALGYSTSGVVLASLDSRSIFQPGDRVACAGQDYASHAEVVAVPQNLVSKIPDGVPFEDAAFTTLGAIALQGVRQAEPRLGDHVCVIGLGLLGQIACQLLRANGCNVFGIDISKDMVDLAARHSAHRAMTRGDGGLLPAAEGFTGGHGFDSVVITAAAPSNDPIELSAEILRKKGRVVMVGSVKMDVPRDPHFYRKELDLVMSCSYGPGRYDPQYEEEGRDYPYGYVRWTENRNMEAFLRLIASRAIDLKPLITHTFPVEQAPKAYDIVLGKTPEKFVGILLQYGDNPQKAATAIPLASAAVKDVNVGFIGAGSFAQSYLLPNVKALAVSLDTVVTNSGINSNNVAKKFGFNRSSTKPEDVIDNPAINTVFIATRHDSHAAYVARCLKAGKSVFVEKPLSIDQAGWQEVLKAYRDAKHPRLMVGYNRRFSPIALKARETFAGMGEPLVVTYRVNAGFIPKDHWTQSPALGGGRIIGEVCHFIDLVQYLTGADPVRVFAECLNAKSQKVKNDDNLSIVLKMSDGSVGTIVYLANGEKALAKERVEISGGNQSFVINDFRGGERYKGGRRAELKLAGKGHAEEVTAFIEAVAAGKPSPIAFESLALTTVAAFKVLDSLRTGLPQEVKVE